MSFNTKEKTNWTTPFIDLFDKLFGKKHLSWECFLKSSAVSIIMLVSIVLFVSTYDKDIQGINFNKSWHLYFLFPFAINLIPDYISLLETRWILNKMNSCNSFTMQIIYLIVDIILTLLIFIALALLWILITQYGQDEMFGPSTHPLDLRGLDFFVASIKMMGIMLATTFFSSIWIWLFLITSLITKTMNRTKGVAHFFQNNLDIEGKPFRSLGAMSVILTTMIYVIIGIWYLFA